MKGKALLSVRFRSIGSNQCVFLHEFLQPTYTFTLVDNLINERI